MLHDAHFYIARQREHATFVEVSRIEASLPSHPGDVPINTVKTAIPSYSRGTFFDYAFQVCPLTAPKYGIFNVTARFRVLYVIPVCIPVYKQLFINQFLIIFGPRADGNPCKIL
jgi:hypothetical protein